MKFTSKSPTIVRYTLALIGALTGVIFSTGCSDKERSVRRNQKIETLEHAKEKVDSGRANELTLTEADALRESNQSRLQKYKTTFDQQIDSKLAKFPSEEVKAYWTIRRAMDAYAEAHEDFPPEKQDEIFSKFSRDLGKPVDELKAIYLKLDAETVLSTQEVKNPKEVEKTEKIDVFIDFQAIKNSRGDIRISGKTNLPESTKIQMSIQLVEKLNSIESLRQGGITVTNGNIQSEWCSRLENGIYSIRLMSITPGEQPESVNKILGKNGENLIGQYVVHPEYLRDGIKVIDKSAFFSLGENPTPEAPNPAFDPSSAP